MGASSWSSTRIQFTGGHRTSAVQYYWSLRCLAYAWAWAGNFRSKDPGGKEHLFISLPEATTHADEALRVMELSLVVEPERFPHERQDGQCHQERMVCWQGPP